MAVAPLIPHPAAMPLAVSVAGLAGVAGIGALLPDMDMPGAKASKLLGPVTWVLAWLINKLSVIVFEATRAEKDKTGRFPGHRELTHTALWGVLLGLGVFLALVGPYGASWAIWWSAGLVVGHFAHLWGDSITLGGIPLWAPFVKINGKRWHCVHTVPQALRFRVGAHHEGKAVPGHSRWAWINIGEGVVTLGLGVLTGVLAALTIWAGGGAWWAGLGMVLG